MSPTRVGVIGAGIAGPILAIFLKSKGYEPVVYERAEAMLDAGIMHGYVYC
jgi:salicylate hydroxylase